MWSRRFYRSCQPNPTLKNRQRLPVRRGAVDNRHNRHSAIQLARAAHSLQFRRTNDSQTVPEYCNCRIQCEVSENLCNAGNAGRRPYEAPSAPFGASLSTDETFQFGMETHMDLSEVFSDDQIAIIGCFVALASCALVAAVSFQWGPAGKASVSARNNLKMDVIREQDGESQQKKAA